MQRTFRQREQVIVLVSGVAALLLALHFFHPPAGGLWTQVFFDSLHVPVFGLISVFIFLIANTALTWQRAVVLALAVTLLLGALSEVVQIFTPRDASLRDLVADGVGAASFLAIFLALRPVKGLSVAKRTAFFGVAILLLGWVLAPLAVVSAAYTERFMQFPTIVGFDSRLGRVLTRTQNIDYRIVEQHQNEPAHALVTLQAKPWPGVAFHDVQPDWEDFATLVIDLAIDGDAALPINIRVHDQAHKKLNEFTDRYNRSFNLQPGSHTVRIPLVDLANAPRNRSMDLTRISEVIIFSDASNAGRSFRLYEIRLE